MDTQVSQRTSKVCLCFGNGKPMLDGFTDADMAVDVDSRKYTSGYFITFAGGAVSWQSKLQNCLALSTTEAEYITRKFVDEEVPTRVGPRARKTCFIL